MIRCPASARWRIVNRYPADTVGALWIRIFPRDVILRACGENVDIVLRRQLLGDEPAMIFGASEDFGAVTLNDEGNFHDSMRPDGRPPTLHREVPDQAGPRWMIISSEWDNDVLTKNAQRVAPVAHASLHR